MQQQSFPQICRALGASSRCRTNLCLEMERKRSTSLLPLDYPRHNPLTLHYCTNRPHYGTPCHPRLLLMNTPLKVLRQIISASARHRQRSRNMATVITANGVLRRRQQPRPMRPWMIS